MNVRLATSRRLRIALATIGLALMYSLYVSAARAQQKALTNDQSQIVDRVNAMFTALQSDDALESPDGTKRRRRRNHRTNRFGRRPGSQNAIAAHLRRGLRRECSQQGRPIWLLHCTTIATRLHRSQQHRTFSSARHQFPKRELNTPAMSFFCNWDLGPFIAIPEESNPSLTMDLETA
jgi:hypothetical protein